MLEQTEVEETQVSTEETNESQQQAPEPSQDEIEAREMGWKPESEFKGNKSDYVSAKEFVRRKSYYDRISAQSKELKELRTVLEGFKEHQKNLETYTRKQILEELKTAKKQALVDGDPDRVIEVDDAIMQYKLKEKEIDAEDKAAKAGNPQIQAQAQQAFQSWVSKNSWYETSTAMRNYADGLGQELKEANPNITPERLFASVEKEVKVRFKERFENANRTKPSAVESSTPGEGSSSKTKYDPSDEERAMARKYVKTGLYKSESEYYADLTKLAKK